MKDYSFTLVYYAYDEFGTSYNEDLDKPLTTLEFESMDKAIKYTTDILLKKHNIKEIDDITMENGNNEVVVFFGKDVYKNGEKYERAIKLIEDDDSILLHDILMENLK